MFGNKAASEAAIFITQAGGERGWILLADDRQDALCMSFVGEEAEAQTMPRASIFDARDLVELVILEPRDISPVGRDWRD
jgi:hypothetical protein